MFESIQHWLASHWWPITLILILAYIARRFGDMALGGLIRRTVRYRAHGDLSEEDIKKRQDTLIIMSSTVLRVLVWLVAGFSLVNVLFAPTIDLAPLLAGASVLGVALGFGAQTLIKDFISGLFIILENQYRVGDVVEIDGASGTVEQITIRSTILRDNDGSVHYVPNGNITHAVNRTMGFAKVNVVVTVKPDTDVDKLADIINELGQKLIQEEKWKDKILEAPRFQSIGSFSETALEVKIVTKTQPSAQWSVMAELRKRLLAVVKKQGITLNLPEVVSNAKKR